MLQYLCVLFLLLHLLCLAVLLDRLAEVAVLKVLDSGLHLIQQPLKFRGPLRLVGRLTHVLLDFLSEHTQRRFLLKSSLLLHPPQGGAVTF